MADVASKQQTTALFLSTTVTLTRRHTELTNLMGNRCCAREHSFKLFVYFFTQINCTVLLRVYWALYKGLLLQGPSITKALVFQGVLEELCSENE